MKKEIVLNSIQTNDGYIYRNVPATIYSPLPHLHYTDKIFILINKRFRSSDGSTSVRIKFNVGRTSFNSIGKIAINHKTEQPGMNLTAINCTL